MMCQRNFNIKANQGLPFKLSCSSDLIQCLWDKRWFLQSWALTRMLVLRYQPVPRIKSFPKRIARGRYKFITALNYYNEVSRLQYEPHPGESYGPCCCWAYMFTPNVCLPPTLDSPVIKFTFIYKILFFFKVLKSDLSYAISHRTLWFLKDVSKFNCGLPVKYFLYLMACICQNLIKRYRDAGYKMLMALHTRRANFFLHFLTLTVNFPNNWQARADKNHMLYVARESGNPESQQKCV